MADKTKRAVNFSVVKSTLRELVHFGEPFIGRVTLIGEIEGLEIFECSFIFCYQLLRSIP